MALAHDSQLRSWVLLMWGDMRTGHIMIGGARSVPCEVCFVLYIGPVCSHVALAHDSQLRSLVLLMWRDIQL